MLLIVKQRTRGHRVIIDLTGHKEQLILDRIPERYDGLRNRQSRAGTITAKRQTIVMIARADNLSQPCDIPYARIDSLAPRDFVSRKGRRSAATYDIRNTIIAHDRKGLIRQRSNHTKSINLRPHANLLHFSGRRKQRSVCVKPNQHAYAISFGRHVHEVNLSGRKHAISQAGIIRNALDDARIKRQ